MRTALEMGWDRFENGSLLTAAEAEGFQLLVTCDRNLRYQQNLSVRQIAIVEITLNDWALIEPQAARVALAANEATEGSYRVVDIQRPFTDTNSPLAQRGE